MVAYKRDKYLPNEITITHVSLFLHCRHYITHGAKKMYAYYVYVLEPKCCSRVSYEKLVQLILLLRIQVYCVYKHIYVQQSKVNEIMCIYFYGVFII